MQFAGTENDLQTNMGFPEGRELELNALMDGAFAKTFEEARANGKTGFNLNELIPKLAPEIANAEEGFYVGFHVANNLNRIKG